MDAEESEGEEKKKRKEVRFSGRSIEAVIIKWVNIHMKLFRKGNC